LRDPTSTPAADTQPQEPRPRLCRFADVLGEVVADAHAAHEARVSGQPRGPITGLKKLDAELGGALPPGPTVIHGGPGVGKTAFALQIAASCRCPALLVTCEMAPAELFRRHMARVCGEYLGRFKSGEMHPEAVQQKARQAAEAAPLLSIVDATRAYASPLYLREVAEIARGDARHLLLIVDSLHSWAEAAPAAATEYDALNAGLAALRTLAHQLACPVLIICERNRAGMKTDSVNAGAGTRKIEYGAETVLSLDRKEDAREDGAGEVAVTLKFAKNRHGAAGKAVALKFHGAWQRFTEAD
jgi:replicative DNA helicase